MSDNSVKIQLPPLEKQIADFARYNINYYECNIAEMLV